MEYVSHIEAIFSTNGTAGASTLNVSLADSVRVLRDLIGVQGSLRGLSGVSHGSLRGFL